MVKFCKQFEALLVPEWKDAFVDYRQLKKDLKNSVNKNLSGDSGSNNHEIIQVRSKTELYETAGDFFTSLDFQLNKVNQFYKGKEKDFVERGDSLKKQMELLLQLKEGQKKSEKDLFCAANADRGLSLQRLKCDCEKGEAQSSEERGEGGKNLDKARRSEESKLRCLSTQPFSHSGKSLEIDIPLTTPLRAISALSCLVCEALKDLRSSKAEKRPCEAGIDKAKLRQAQKMIRGAYIELYKGLGFLETYRNMNMLAFAKILSKFDEVMQKQTLPVYLKVVESSYFNTSIKAVRLMDEVEDYFTQHFADGNKKKAFQYLKPIQQKESHAVTFLIGLFTGCFIALLAGYCIMAHIAGMYTSNPDTVYMETVYPVLCVFSLFFLHLFLYGCNIIMWRKTRINYRFIFELSPNNELKYRDVFLICSTSMTIVVGTMFAHLSSIYNGYTSNYIQAVPGILLLIFVVVLLCPINIIYRSSRYKFLRIIRNIIFSPFYKVFMVDFFMADQLCSQVPMLRSLEYATCYYITRSYKTQDYKFCTTHFITLAYAVSFLPYYWRAMQCARRWFDEGETSHLVNLGKYVSAILAAGAKIAYEKDMSIGKFFLVVVLSCAATVYQLYWDFVKDWGLLQPNSKNPWLRDELILHRKSMYFLSMGLNLVLRLAWIQSVLHSNIGNLDYRVISFFLAALEVIRRGHWNFYRLENEHLNNVGKFRAVKTVPLPFHGVGQD